MDREEAGFYRALALERKRNSRQISAFRFFALLVILGLQSLFLLMSSDWVGAPMGPLLGYTAAAAVAWRLRNRFDAWAAWSGYTVAAVDMPMAFWLVRSSARASVEAGTPELADPVLMLLPVGYAGFILMAALTWDVRQTILVAVTAIVLQWMALSGGGQDFTFLSMLSAFTMLIAVVCVYWRQQSVRLVRETSVEQLRRERLGRYFSPQVATLVETGAMETGARRRQVTVMFADIRDFTRLSERLDPRQVVVLLNRFHTAMVAVVFANGGTLDKYLGDGLMAYFGAPVEQADQAERAVRCAMGMQRALDTLNAQGVVAGETLRMGIGLHTGLAVVGDIGASSRREFTVIGDAVNVAARLEGLTKTMKVPILVSATTARGCGDSLPLRLVERVELRGRLEPVEVYTPEEARSPAEV